MITPQDLGGIDASLEDLEGLHLKYGDPNMSLKDWFFAIKRGFEEFCATGMGFQNPTFQEFVSMSRVEVTISLAIRNSHRINPTPK